MNLTDDQLIGKIDSASLVDDDRTGASVRLSIAVPRGMFDAHVNAQGGMTLLWRARANEMQIDLTQLHGLAVIVESTSTDSYRYLRLA